MKSAIIDLGTNTFNLLIAESKPGRGFKILWDKKLPVKLGSGGIGRRLILPDAMERAYSALAEHQETIRAFGVTHAKAFGTSGIRTATNGKDFVQSIQDKFGFDVEIISGNREAELIYKGIRASVALTENPVLILDVGGGSNEFIIGNKDSMFWRRSYKLGVARLLEFIKPSDPITPEEVRKAETRFRDTLKDLTRTAPGYRFDTLIGASGSFETFASLLQASKGDRYTIPDGESSQEIDLDDYRELYFHLVQSSAVERCQMPGMEPIRVDYIVLAAVFVTFVLSHFSIKRLIQTQYSLKEGAMAEMIELQE